MDKDFGKDDGKKMSECDDNNDKNEKETVDRSTNPHVGEDPGLLESTEDPRERRLKRNTM